MLQTNASTTCPICGFRNNTGARFCGRCGNAITPPKPADPSNDPSPGMIKVAIVCGVIVFIGLMVYLVLTWSSRFGGRIVGTWITETPNEYIHKITFYGDNSGYMEGPNGEGRFNWSGDERAIVIAPYDPDYSQDGSSQENFDFKISISEDGDILRIDIDKPGDTFQFHRAD